MAVMLKKSNYSGQAIPVFPDVCKTPVPILGVVPIPSPNIGATAGSKTASKSTAMKLAGTKPANAASTGDEPGVLKGQLSALHQKIMTMPAGDAAQWHQTLDDYVLTTAKVFTTLSNK